MLPSAGAESAGGRLVLKQVLAETLLDDWKIRDYEAMRDDVSRTSKFEAAIKRRLADTGGQAVVADIGTGSFALLAIMAARAGAKRVYAVERNHAAAERAKETVERAGLKGQIEVIEGDALKIELPERVDLVVSELIGSIATQEGVEPIIRDAQRRHLKPGGSTLLKPAACQQMIPARCQTCVAPVSYRDHKWVAFKKGVQSRGKPEPESIRPLRLLSDTKDLDFLAPPQFLEDFNYCADESVAAVRAEDRRLQFTLSPDVREAASRFSGFALWTRVVVDDVDVVEVGGQKSHWAYVVALMSPDPVQLTVPGTIELRTLADYTATPVRYTFEADVPV